MNHFCKYEAQTSLRLGIAPCDEPAVANWLCRSTPTTSGTGKTTALSQPTKRCRRSSEPRKRKHTIELCSRAGREPFLNQTKLPDFQY